MHSREAKPNLRLIPGHHDRLKAVGVVHDLLQQLRLADARIAGDDQSGAETRA